ncbi:nucleotidyltransferase domain-containing protein [Robertmurraya sp. DFI.2.37]|uniref:nucleotidyltransferase domain-containing protein n=1 Tax=Robertmurraya sp. DFI.2.37 TaxID=3031819 RepID=UPI001243E9A8|nr:nucleotidyltransferase domain-containing protein [Robertmurraya sp. DFI.2.37]MDF1507525.1 nucleotidyltransferase domain-containing protein [Robertmurraya sp. DFI.2.37]
MKEIILKSLMQIEEEYHVKILYAVESGSRAWEFPSKDSDYDVRFIYVHKVEDYLTIDQMGIGKKRDVIELPINNLLDITGWELTKALRLLRKSNPPLLEWLHSGIVYYQAFSTIEQMKKLSQHIFTPHSCIHHYLNMASNNFREYLQGDEVKIKKYFYVLRPILAAQWIEKYNQFPPLEFTKLLENLLPDGDLKKEIETLLTRKMSGEELALESKIDVINDFVNEEILRLRAYTRTLNKDAPDWTPKLDLLFKNTLKEVWN